MFLRLLKPVSSGAGNAAKKGKTWSKAKENKSAGGEENPRDSVPPSGGSQKVQQEARLLLCTLKKPLRCQATK